MLIEFNVQKIDKQELIVDVGSNDGTLLRCFKNRVLIIY